MKKGDIVKITKVSDDTFGGMHPNGINPGYEKTGVLINPPKVGNKCIVGTLTTSDVVEIISETRFKTIFSTYDIVPA